MFEIMIWLLLSFSLCNSAQQPLSESESESQSLSDIECVDDVGDFEHFTSTPSRKQVPHSFDTFCKSQSWFLLHQTNICCKLLVDHLGVVCLLSDHNIFCTPMEGETTTGFSEKSFRQGLKYKENGLMGKNKNTVLDIVGDLVLFKVRFLQFIGQAINLGEISFSLSVRIKLLGIYCIYWYYSCWSLFITVFLLFPSNQI